MKTVRKQYENSTSCFENLRAFFSQDGSPSSQKHEFTEFLIKQIRNPYFA